MSRPDEERYKASSLEYDLVIGKWCMYKITLWRILQYFESSVGSQSVATVLWYQGHFLSIVFPVPDDLSY